MSQLPEYNDVPNNTVTVTRMTIHSLWVEKYRPTNLDEYIFHDDEHKRLIESYVEQKSIPHLLLGGIRGCGKTSIAKILINSMDLNPDTDVRVINASKDRGIDTIREVTSFATTVGMGAFKIIHFEEADKLTPDAQMALKAFTEENVDYVRFIFTCNNPNLIIPELQSRVHDLYFKAPNKDDVVIRLYQILIAENVKASRDVVNRYVDVYYPDIRKMINAMQQRSVEGKLMPLVNAGGSGDFKLQLLPLMERGDWQSARQLIIGNIVPSEWVELYRFLYDNIDKCQKFKQGSEEWGQAIMLIADHLYRHTLVADPEINAASLLIQIGNI